MELNSNSWIVKWAYWPWFHAAPPNVTTLCGLFWRAVLLTPALGLGVAVLAPIWVPWWFFETRYGARFRDWQLRRERPTYERATARIKKEWDQLDHPGEPSAWRVLWEGAKAVKSKACPLVTIRRDESSTTVGLR